MRVLYILAFVLWNAYSVVAQDFGSLTGKVKTEDGEILFGANVIVKGPAIEEPRGASPMTRETFPTACVEALRITISDRRL